MRKIPLVLLSMIVLTMHGCSGKFSNLYTSFCEEPSGEVSAYLQGGYIDAQSAVTKLKRAGFEVLATYKSIENSKTILFTCENLKEEGAKEGRAFISVMRMLIDEKLKTISITNPVYFAKAYMQQEYDYETFAAIKANIEGAFTGLKDSEDRMDYHELDSYNFAVGMPYYEDQKVIAEAPNALLLAKAREYQNGKRLVFELKLSETSTLLGYELRSGTKRFVKKIGRENAGLLPWCISVEEDKAKILQGEYYIALNYPLLNMMAYMDITNTPDDVIEDLSLPFKR